MSRDLERGGFVHVIWDVSSVPLPSDTSAVFAAQRITELAESYGIVGSFKCMVKEGELESDMKRTLQETGVEIEEIVSESSSDVDVFILTRLLRITLSLQLSAVGPRPILVLLTSHRSFSRALSLARRSGLYGEVVLIHSGDAHESLVHSCTVAMEWQAFLSGPPIPRPLAQFTQPFANAQQIQEQMSTLTEEQAKGDEQAPKIVQGQLPGVKFICIRPPPVYIPVPVTPQLNARSLQHSNIDLTKDVGMSKDQSSSSQVGIESMDKEYRFPAHEPSQRIPSLTLTSSTSDDSASLSASSNSSSDSVLSGVSGLNIDHTAKLDESALAGLGIKGVMNSPSTRYYVAPGGALTPVKPTNKRSNSTITATINSPANHQQQAPVSASVTSSPALTPRTLGLNPAAQIFQVQAPRTAANVPMDRLSPRARTSIVQFHRVLQYCEQEKIIPRESVLKKRLMDSKQGAEIDFEDWVNTVKEAGIAYVEGDAPQRVIWPRQGDGARKFACADFFQPTARLSKDQSDELIAFLQQYKPEVDRGRFGFAQYLARHGPKNIQLLPHGVLVELVQLLLNQKVLLFRKGKVSVNPVLPNADEREANAATAGAVISTPASSTSTTPVSSRPSTPTQSPRALGLSSWPEQTVGVTMSNGSTMSFPGGNLSAASNGNAASTTSSSSANRVLGFSNRRASMPQLSANLPWSLRPSASTPQSPVGSPLHNSTHTFNALSFNRAQSPSFTTGQQRTGANGQNGQLMGHKAWDVNNTGNNANRAVHSPTLSPAAHAAAGSESGHFPSRYLHEQSGEWRNAKQAQSGWKAESDDWRERGEKQSNSGTEDLTKEAAALNPSDKTESLDSNSSSLFAFDSHSASAL